uniref:Gag protein n=1 Tax=Panagrolaimus davidi TaxID=227884 RepID=A0A914Q1H0_9BILA
MSGTIRTGLGRDRAVARKHCDEYEDAIAASPAPWRITEKGRFDAIMGLLERDLKKLEDGWKKWETLIDRIRDEAEQDAEQALYDEWKDKEEYEKIMDDLPRFIIQIKSYRQAEWTPAAAVAPSIVQSSDDEEKEVLPLLQIPSLNIPKFNGDYLEWNTFWELFDLYVHKKNYPDVSKFAALRSLLQGRALDEIKGFTTSGTNYDTVVKTLKDRFGNQQFVIRELELSLDRIPPAQPNASSIGSTVTAVTNMCRQLKNLGIDTNNNSMKNTVIKKMPLRQQQQLQELLFDEPTTSIDIILDKMKKMEMKAELFASIAAPSHSSPTPPRKPFVDSYNKPKWEERKIQPRDSNRPLPSAEEMI